MPKIERLMIDGQAKPFSHYCHVTKAGNLIWFSAPSGLPPTAASRTMSSRNSRSPSRHGCRPESGPRHAEHVVKVTVYLTNVDDRAKINPIWQRYFGTHRPASTLVEVSALVLPELKVEIEAQAILP